MIHFDSATHTYTVDGKPFASVTQVIAGAGLYGDAAKFYDDYSRDRGRIVHRIIELYCNDELDESSIDASLRGYFNAWLAFENDTKFFPAYIEYTLYNQGIRVAGRADLIGPFNDKAAIIDIKTSINASPVTGIQLAGYEYLYGAHVQRLALHLGPDGKYRLHEYKDRHDRDVFLAAVSLFNWKQTNLKGG